MNLQEDVLNLLKKVLKVYFIDKEFGDDPCFGLIMIANNKALGIDDIGTFLNGRRNLLKSFTISWPTDIFKLGNPLLINNKWNGSWNSNQFITISKIPANDLINLYFSLIKWNQDNYPRKKINNNKIYYLEDSSIQFFKINKNNISTNSKLKILQEKENRFKINKSCF